MTAAQPERARVLRTAAAYVRMSTRQQDLSVEQQLDYIARYAATMHYQLVRVYRDEGKSGVTLRRRPGLLQLLADVAAGGHGYEVLLVYDVSRWGRFMDIDQAACYEFLCWQAGIQVVYCAELFGPEAAPMQHLMKDIKRLMAAERSRELSARTFEAHSYLLRQGYKPGGVAGYGLQRLSIRADGTLRRALVDGERKGHQTDRVVLAPGDAEEVRVVRWIFRAYIDEQLSYAALARRLNRQREPSRSGTPWSAAQVRAILCNEKYCGNLLYNRTTGRLGAPRRSHTATEWQRCAAAHAAIVSVSEFAQAGRQLALRRGLDRDAVLAAVRALYQQHGRLSYRLIEAQPGLPHGARLKRMFGDMAQLYRAALGDASWPPRGMAHACSADLRQALQRQVCGYIVETGHTVAPTTLPQVVLIDGALTLRIAVASCVCKGSCWGWRVPSGAAGADFVICGLRARDGDRLMHYVLLQAGQCSAEHQWVGSGLSMPARGLVVADLRLLFGLGALTGVDEVEIA